MWTPGQTWRLEPWRNRAAAMTVSLAILAAGVATGFALGHWNANGGAEERPAEESMRYEDAMIVMSYYDSLTWTEVQSDGRPGEPGS